MRINNYTYIYTSHSRMLNKPEEKTQENLDLKPIEKSKEIVDISEEGKEMVVKITEKDGIDIERLNNIKDAIKNSTYKVSSDLIADKMLEKIYK